MFERFVMESRTGVGVGGKCIIFSIIMARMIISQEIRSVSLILVI